MMKNKAFTHTKTNVSSYNNTHNPQDDIIQSDEFSSYDEQHDPVTLEEKDDFGFSSNSKELSDQVKASLGILKQILADLISQCAALLVCP